MIDIRSWTEAMEIIAKLKYEKLITEDEITEDFISGIQQQIKEGKTSEEITNGYKKKKKKRFFFF